MEPTVYVTNCEAWHEAVGRLFDEPDLATKLKHACHVLLKPNLVSTQPPPVTTPVALAEALIILLQKRAPRCRVTVAGGTGAISHDTFHCFHSLGYGEMAARLGVKLLDLNTETLVC